MLGNNTNVKACNANNSNDGVPCKHTKKINANFFMGSHKQGRDKKMDGTGGKRLLLEVIGTPALVSSRTAVPCPTNIDDGGRGNGGVSSEEVHLVVFLSLFLVENFVGLCS